MRRANETALGSVGAMRKHLSAARRIVFAVRFPVIWFRHGPDEGLAVKTTLDLNDRILRQAKERAARDGVTLTRFVEDALRARLTSVQGSDRPFRLRLETVTGTAPPKIDVSDRDALYDVIDHA